MPAVRLPPVHAGDAVGPADLDRVAGGRDPHPFGRSHDRPTGAGLVQGRALDARSGQRPRWLDDRRRRGAHPARRAARRGAARGRRRGSCRRRQGHLRDRGPARAGRPRPAQRHVGGARALPQPAAREDRARSARPDRRARRRVRRPAHPGGEVHARRAGARVGAAARRPERHAVDDLAAPVARARARARHDARDRRRPLGAGHAARASRAAREPRPGSGGADRSRRRARARGQEPRRRRRARGDRAARATAGRARCSR